MPSLPKLYDPPYLSASYWKFESIVPGPLTLRIMLRVVSSMNSTRTWVTPPREPKDHQNLSFCMPLRILLLADVLNVPVRPKTRVTFTSLTGTFEDSISAIWWCLVSGNFAVIELRYELDDCAWNRECGVNWRELESCRCDRWRFRPNCWVWNFFSRAVDLMRITWLQV